MSTRLPETLVLFATVHGVIPVDEGVERLFTVPPGMKITRVMATRPGICNLTQEDQINSIVLDMKKAFGETVTSAQINSVLESIKPATRELVKGLPGNMKADVENKELFQQFIRSHIKTPVVKEFLPGQPIIDKYLARSPDEGIESAYDFKLNIINIPGTPDLFDIAALGRTGPSAALRKDATLGRGIDLSSLVNGLSGMGVKHLVLFDFTCSSFDSVVTDRAERSLRRDMLQRGVGKRRTRRRNKKTKTRKGKKRTTQWKH